MVLCAAAAACSATSSPDLVLDLANPKKPAVVLNGLSRADLRALQTAAGRAAQIGWSALFRVSVTPDGQPGALPMAGEYTIADGQVRFTPVVPFEGGRPYNATFDPAAAPGGTLAHLHKITRVLSTPAPARAPQVHVTEIYPSGTQVPANLLRMYVEFSGPMGTRPGQDYVRLVDAAGRDIPDALLPLDTDLWNGDRTRFTILFDPGRVKRGILPNRKMGRPLHDGGTFTLLIARDWPDANGQPLSAPFTKTYRVGPAREAGLSARAWKVATPASGSRDPLRVTFPFPLDRGLLQRALGVIHVDAAGERTIAGDVTVEPGETAWRFVPQEPWAAGEYVISVLPALEDPSGNRIGQAFETREADDGGAASPAPARLPFRVR